MSDYANLLDRCERLEAENAELRTKLAALPAEPASEPKPEPAPKTAKKRATDA